jgi:hypothetical protein
MQKGIETWIATQRRNGWTVEAAPVSIGGWPRAVVAVIPALKMARSGGSDPGGHDDAEAITVQSGGVVLSLPLFHPSALDIALRGTQSLAAGARPPLIITGDAIGGTVGLGVDGNQWASLRAAGLRVQPESGIWQARCGLLEGEARVLPPDTKPPGIDVKAQASDIDLPAEARWPLGPSIRLLSIAGMINGPLPLVANAAAWTTAWRDGGGSVEVRRLTIDWGPLNLNSTATLALDDQLQPMGTGSAKVTGYAETLDRMAASGLMTKSAATVAKAMLSLLAGTDGGETPASVDVPLTLQYRTLSMRQVPLVRLPELDWRSQ